MCDVPGTNSDEDDSSASGEEEVVQQCPSESSVSGLEGDVFRTECHRVATKLAGGLAEACGRGIRWIGDILWEVTFDEAKRIVEGFAYTGRGYAAVFHPEEGEIGHVHLYHACVFTGSHCRFVQTCCTYYC